MFSLKQKEWYDILKASSKIEITATAEESKDNYGLIEFKYDGKYHTMLFDNGVIFYE